MATQEGQTAALARVIAELREDPETLAEAVMAARAMGRPVKALPEHEVRRHIHSLLDALVAMLREQPEQSLAAATAADGLASDRARQGVPLDVLLDGVQSARSVLLRAVVAAAGQFMTAEELLPLLIRLDGAASILTNRMVVSYQRAEHDLGRTRRNTQVEALRELLSGGSISWATEASLELTGRYHCVLVDVSAPSESRRLEPLIDSGDGVSGIVHGYLCGISTRLPSSERLGGVLSVVSPLVGVDRLSQVYALCREALVVCREQGRAGVQPLTGVAFTVATSAYPGLGRLLCEELLAALDPAEEFHRLLAATALTYLEQGHRTERAAAVLHVHPNTVKYRIRRFGELTGPGDDTQAFGQSLAATVNWWWALTTWLAEVPAPG